MIPLSRIGSTDVYMIGEGRVERIRLDVQCAQPLPRAPDRSNIVIVEVRRKRAYFDLAKTTGTNQIQAIKDALLVKTARWEAYRPVAHIFFDRVVNYEKAPSHPYSLR